jgi:hypothetical protein
MAAPLVDARALTNPPGSVNELKFLDAFGFGSGVPGLKMPNYNDVANNVVSTTTMFNTDSFISAMYATMCWEDGTHVLTQEYQLVFVQRYNDYKTHMSIVVPIFKLNQLARDAFSQYRALCDAGDVHALEFQAALRYYGEQALADYHIALRCGYETEMFEDLPDGLTMRQFYERGIGDMYCYLTQFGIVNRWNFLGAVLSKCESTGAGSYLDHHSATDTVYVMGVVLAKRAVVTNIFGPAAVGSRVGLILRRQANGVFQFHTTVCDKREYPTSGSLYYQDASGRQVRAWLKPLGQVTEASQNLVFSETKRQVALGLRSHIKEAFEAHGSLPTMIIQIGV